MTAFAVGIEYKIRKLLEYIREHYMLRTWHEDDWQYADETEEPVVIGWNYEFKPKDQ